MQGDHGCPVPTAPSLPGAERAETSPFPRREQTATLSGAVAFAIFLVFFGIYSFRLGVQPALMHDDYEYTYPSFNLAERGNFGSPLLGTALNIHNRTYNLVVYYYASVHAVLIRIFGDGAAVDPAGQHVSLRPAGRVRSLLSGAPAGVPGPRRLPFRAHEGRADDRRRAPGAAGDDGGLLSSSSAVLALWLWHGEGRRRPAVLFAMSAALTAGMLSHTSVAFFGAALLLVFLVPRARQARPRELLAALLPFAIVPLLYAYFVLTDSVANIRGQLAPVQGDLLLAGRVKLALHGQWAELATLTIEFVRTHLWTPVPWLGAAAGLAAPALFASSWSRGARFFAQTYCLFLVVHYLLLKHFVVSYQVIYLATLYVALAFLAEGIAARLGELWPRPAWIAAARVAGIAVLAVLSCALAGPVSERAVRPATALRAASGGPDGRAPGGGSPTGRSSVRPLAVRLPTAEDVRRRRAPCAQVLHGALEPGVPAAGARGLGGRSPGSGQYATPLLGDGAGVLAAPLGDGLERGLQRHALVLDLPPQVS